jgi:hypothetical protein
MRQAAAVAIVVTAMSAAVLTQRRGGRVPQDRIRTPADSPYDGAFRLCRIMFRNSSDRDGNGW